ncbi:hypothetical protein J7K50_04115 [bacterium]|nr:hypothetical protein [bacterium]
MTDKSGKTGEGENHDRRICPKCGHTMVYGELSHSANFGVTKDPHFVTSYGFMQVRYDRATPVDCFMCMSCGFIEQYGRTPLSVLDPIERQKLIKDEFPDLKEYLEKTRDKIDRGDRMSRLDSYDDKDDEDEGDDEGPKHIGI